MGQYNIVNLLMIVFEGIMENIFKLIPKINHPIILIAFVIAIFSLVIKLIVDSNKLKTLQQKQSFILLKNLLNYLLLISILTILLSFTIIFYQSYSENNLKKTHGEILSSLVDDLKNKAYELKRNRLSTSDKDKIFQIQPYIFKLGKQIEMEKASKIIMDLYDEIKIPELSPAFLVISKNVLKNIFNNPFNYCYGPLNYRWDKNDSADWNFNEIVENQWLDLEKFNFLLQIEYQFFYKDFLFFLNGNFNRIIQDYPKSILSDASVYAQIKSSLLNDDYVTAIEYAELFKKIYSNHRHLDDAYVLKVLCYELSGKPLKAFYTAKEGLNLPDGDMHPWFYEELFVIAERFMNSKELEKIIRNEQNTDLLGNYKYTYAHHLMAEKKYEEAYNYFKEIRFQLKKGGLKFNLPKYWASNKTHDIDIDDDIAKSYKLMKLNEDKTLNGIYKLGLKYYDDELIHYNKLHNGWRRTTDKYREVRTPNTYYERRNNYYSASICFKIVSKETNDLHLKQKSLYKLARCYQHLSYNTAFYIDTIGNFNRKSYGNQCVNFFLKGRNVNPYSELADDCLVEAGYLSCSLIGDCVEGKRLLNMVISEYEGKNAADNAMYILANIYEGDGEYDKALRTYILLYAKHLSKRWEKISIQNIQSLKIKIGK